MLPSYGHTNQLKYLLGILNPALSKSVLEFSLLKEEEKKTLLYL